MFEAVVIFVVGVPVKTRLGRVESVVDGVSQLFFGVSVKTRLGRVESLALPRRDKIVVYAG